MSKPWHNVENPLANVCVESIRVGEYGWAVTVNGMVLCLTHTQSAACDIQNVIQNDIIADQQRAKSAEIASYRYPGDGNATDHIGDTNEMIGGAK